MTIALAIFLRVEVTLFLVGLAGLSCGFVSDSTPPPRFQRTLAFLGAVGTWCLTATLVAVLPALVAAIWIVGEY